MQSEDRVIHFSAELIHAPVTPNKPMLQKLYYDLSQIKGAGYESTDFTNPTQVRFYSRRGKKTQSIALFLPDRLVLIEEWADIPLSTFGERVRIVAGLALEARSVPCYLLHTATIRSTFALSYFDDAKTFIIDHVCAQENRMATYLQRPVAVGGIRLVLPETNENPGAYHVTIESFRHSNNEVFVEVKGIFGRQQIFPGQEESIIDNIRNVRTYITDNIFPYLDQYDIPENDNN